MTCVARDAHEAPARGKSASMIRYTLLLCDLDCEEAKIGAMRLRNLPHHFTSYAVMLWYSDAPLPLVSRLHVQCNKRMTLLHVVPANYEIGVTSETIGAALPHTMNSQQRAPLPERYNARNVN